MYQLKGIHQSRRLCAIKGTLGLCCDQPIDLLWQKDVKTPAPCFTQSKVWATGVMAPAVNQTMRTAVNPGLGGSEPPIPFFKEEYPSKAPLHILGGKRVCGVAEMLGKCFVCVSAYVCGCMGTRGCG